jgi:uncharacterized repeat protein (TIGR01451 family)
MSQSLLRVAASTAAALVLVGAAGQPRAGTAAPQQAAEAGKIAYVYNTNTALRDSFKTFLESRGFAVTPISLTAVTSFDFSTVDTILIADDTGNTTTPYTWLGGRLEVGRILQSEKPIVSLGYGAQYFDAHGGLNIGWGPSWVATEYGAIAVNPADGIWTAPNTVPLAADESVRLYSLPHTTLAVYDPEPSAVQRIGRQLQDQTHYPIASQSWTGQFGATCRTEWGYRRGPEAMTPYGKDAFVNLLSGNPCNRGQRVRTDVTIEKRASAQSVLVGQVFTYTLIVSNLGPAAAPNVVVEDVVPAGVVVNGITTSAGSCALAVSIITCNLGTLPADATVTITITVKATEPGKPVNTARVRGNHIDLKPDNNSSTVTVDVTQPPTFTALKAFPYVKPLAFTPVTLPADLSIFGIEITQGIQCFNTNAGLAGCADNSLTAVAKKEAAARIYLRYNPALGTGSLSNVPVRLHIFANGVEYIANTQGRATNAIDQGVNDSANVWFNVDFNSDVNVSFYAVVDPGNVIAESNEGNNRYPAVGTIALNFKKQKTLKIVGQRLRYHPPGYTGEQYAGGWAVNGGAADWLEQMLPIRNNGINYVLASGYKDWTQSLGNGDGQHALIRNLNTNWLLQNAFAWLFGAGAYTGANHVYGWAPNAGYAGGHADMPVYPHAGGLGIVGIGTDRTSDGANTTDNPGGGALIFGHEIVHDYNVLHTDTTDSCGSGDDNSTFPYASSSIQEFGFNPLTGKIYAPGNTHDLMSYCPAGGTKQGWISPFTWNTMAAKLDAPSLAFAADAQQMANGPVLVTSISVSNPDLGPQTARFDVAHKLDAAMPLVTPAPGDYALQLRTSAGAVLATVPFTVSFLSEYSAHSGAPHQEPGSAAPTAEAGAHIVTPWIDGTARLVVLRNGTPLLERSVSANAPLVAFTSPASAVTWTAGTTETLVWSGVDPDGDPLTYSLLYSHDGANWDMLATGLTTGTYAIAVDSLKGGPTARFRVVANDGVLSGDDETNFPISVPNKPPLALITSPGSAATISIGELVVLQGTGQDFEDGTLPELSLAWASDRAGALGTGVSLPIDSLEPGWHTITLTVVDSNGQSASSTQRIYIGERVMLPLTSK